MNLKFRRELVALFIFIFLAIGLIQFISFSYAQDNGESEIFDSNFEIIEISEKSETILNQKSINLEFPSSEWSVSNIELNFTNIEIEKELIEVETVDSGIKNLNKQKPGYAVQINVTESINSIDLI